MLKAIVFPAKYVQGPGAISSIGYYTKPLGEKALLVTDSICFEIGGKAAVASFERENLVHEVEIFNGECTRKEISRVAQIAQAKGCDIIVGLGAGKVIDTARAAAFEAETKLAVAPTSCTSTAPISSSSVVYRDDHTFEVELVFPHNPDVIIADTSLIVMAPPAHLVAGIGDALAAYYEGVACEKSRAKAVDGGERTLTVSAIATACKENLFAYGVAAKLSAEHQQVTAALERVVEAVFLMAGLSFEGPSCAAAHAIDTGMLNTLEELKKFRHGQIVAFTTLAALVLEQYPLDEIKRYVELIKKLGLPTCLKDFGIVDVEGSRPRLMKSAEVACQRAIMKNEPFEVTPDMAFDAILGANLLGTYYNKQVE